MHAPLIFFQIRPKLDQKIGDLVWPYTRNVPNYEWLGQKNSIMKGKCT